MNYSEVDITIFIILIVFLISSLVSIFVGNYQQSRLKIFLAIMGLFGIFVTLLVQFRVIDIQTNVNRETKNKNGISILEEFVKMNSLFGTYTSKIPHFMYESNKLLPYKFTIPPDKEDINTELMKKTFASQLFGIWNEYIVAGSIKAIDPIGVNVVSLLYTNNDEMDEYWDLLKYNYSDKTQTLGDLYFKYTKQIKEQTPDEYFRVANEVFEDPIYKQIFI